MTDFDKIIWRDALTFVDFFATWCGPCRMMMPDIDDPSMREIIRRYNIMSVPTLMFFCRGEVLWRESGRVGYEHLINVLNELEKREQVMQP